MSVEKLTVSIIAVMHGDSEIISEGETWEAETREELAQRLAAFLRETADQLDASRPGGDIDERQARPDIGEITRQAYERGQRDERALKEMGF